MANSNHSRTNCKPGDTAVVVKGPNRGALVTVHKAYFANELFAGYNWGSKHESGRMWIVSSLGSALHVHTLCGIKLNRRMMDVVLNAAYLRPLRAEAGEDETIEWAGKTEDIGFNRAVDMMASAEKLPPREKALAFVVLADLGRNPGDKALRKLLQALLQSAGG